MIRQTDQNKVRPDWLTIAAFVIVVFIGGINYIGIRFSNRELDPLYGATLRFGLASLLLFIGALAARLPLPKGKALVGASLFGVLGFGAYGFLYVAIVRISAGTASIVMAAVPLLTLFLAFVHGLERLHIRGIVGGVLVIAGIGLVSRGGQGELPVFPLVMMLCAVLAVAESAVLVKKFPRSHPVTTNAVAMAIGAALLALVSLMLGERWVLPARQETLLALSYLVVVGSIGLFMLFLFIIGRWTASASSYSLTLFPIVAIALGVLIDDQPLSPMLFIGGAVVLGGVYLGAFTRATPVLERGPAGGADIRR
ncbi:MAG TPA: EamA family transporter [Actinomycetota bacterium]|nr:EamA family transporter [Actinomycetota bacterium]